LLFEAVRPIDPKAYSPDVRLELEGYLQKSLLSKTGRNLATRVANGGLACPELEF
jgi:hypothetical protein